MGNNEEFIYGDRHGAIDRIYDGKVKTTAEGKRTAKVLEHDHFPNALEITHAGLSPQVVVKVIGFDDDGNRLENPLAVVLLNRSGSNRLVSAVRKMRDKAFGADA